MDKKSLISIIAPAYNEEKLLLVFVKEVVSCLEKVGLTSTGVFDAKFLVWTQRNRQGKPYTALAKK